MNETTVFTERDISWLSFNERVLQEAKDPRVPLYERLKFLAIYSSNLDEFFRVRVASIRSFRKLKKKTKRAMELKPRKLLKKIRKIVHQQQTEFGRIFKEVILPELAHQNIFLINEEKFTEEQRAYALQYFDENLHGLLSFENFGPEQSPFLVNKALYLLLTFEENEDMVCVKIPDDNRFILFPGSDSGYFISFIDDIIRVGLQKQFKGKKIQSIFSVKMSRDAEIYIDDEYEGDLLDKIKKGLKERAVGLPTRLLYDDSIPEESFQKLKLQFRLNNNDMIPGGRYHNFNDFFGFPDPTNNSALHYPPFPPLAHPELEEKDQLLDLIKNQDYLLHYPYQKFDYTNQLLHEAAKDPNVVSIKITLYRVASKSSIAEGLLKALENGKKVSVFIEAKARFDEESNLYWGNKLTEAGAHVRYSFPGIKVHTKLLMISRNEERILNYYAYIATGNFNEKTAKIYSDFALMTGDPRLTQDVNQVFEMLEGKLILPKTKHALVAPHTLRTGFEKLINQEIKNAKQGKEAWMILKMNSLEDEGMMQKLIEASQAGVSIQLIVRGICCLNPGVPGLTENISIISIVDRFLEHARVYLFCAGGKEKIYLASADWMKRNLSHRVEFAFPVLDEKNKALIKQIIELQLNDTKKARLINMEQSNPYADLNLSTEKSAQELAYALFKAYSIRNLEEMEKSNALKVT